MERGSEGSPVPDSAVGLRMCYANKDAQKSPNEGAALTVAFDPVKVFSLGSEDRAAVPPHLSVYEESMTTLQQARDLTGGMNLALRLPAREVREVIVHQAQDHRLDVLWLAATMCTGDARMADTRPGSEGHLGITGIMAFSRIQRKELRVRLRDIAVNNGPVSVLM